MQSVIFDFNGTLFSDSYLHEEAWQQFIQELIGRKFSQEEFSQVHGRTNHLIIEAILGKPLTKTEGEELSDRKEALYRDLVVKEEHQQLIPGVVDYFEFLKEHNFPMNIATASPKVNLDFYFEIFQLDRWFDYNQVVYNDGILESKPAPDFYIQAALNINASPSEMIIFEDSLIGLTGAANAKAKHIVAVATDENHKQLEETGLVDFVIDDFNDPRIKEILLR
ncbi:HAD family hydrolase [Enterococcus sp. LJL128]